MGWKHQWNVVILSLATLLHYQCNKTNLEHGGYIDSLGWIKKNKKAKISPIIDDGKCFQHSATVALNHKEIGKKLQRIYKMKPFISKYKSRGINYR